MKHKQKCPIFVLKPMPNDAWNCCENCSSIEKSEKILKTHTESYGMDI